VTNPTTRAALSERTLCFQPSDLIAIIGPTPDAIKEIEVIARSKTVALPCRSGVRESVKTPKARVSHPIRSPFIRGIMFSVACAIAIKRRKRTCTATELVSTEFSIEPKDYRRSNCGRWRVCLLHNSKSIKRWRFP
jgi:hypothetical protein